jgi:hypothetical protein
MGQVTLVPEESSRPMDLDDASHRHASHGSCKLIPSLEDPKGRERSERLLLETIFCVPGMVNTVTT